MVEVGVPIVRLGVGAGSLMKPLQGQHGVGWGDQVQLHPTHPTPRRGSDPSVLFTVGDNAPPVPSVGMPGGGDHPDSLFAPPQVRFYCDPGGGQMTITSLPYLWHVCIPMIIEHKASLYCSMSTEGWRCKWCLLTTEKEEAG